MLKICFVMDDVADIGGVQRVSTIVINELVKYNINISLLFTSSIKKSKNHVYKIDDRINIHYTNKFHQKRTDYVLQKILRKVNENIFKINNLSILEKIYFPQKELNKYESFFKENKYDVVIGITPKITGIISLLNDDSKKIGWLHSTYERYFKVKGEYCWNQEVLYDDIFNNLEKLIVLTDQAQSEYANKFNILPKRIYNPLSFKVEGYSSLKSQNLLFLGRIQYNTKGIDLLIQIMDKVIKKNDNITLNIVGDGPDREKLIKEIKTKNLMNNVKYHGKTTDVSEYFLKNSVLVLPSKIEGFGLVVIEAMEYGLPVISFKTEGPSEIIENNSNGFLINNFDTIEFSEKILKLMSDEKLRDKMSDAAKERANDFSANKIGNQWYKLLYEI